ncbi:ribonuclease-III-like-domain-containing protein [Kalaharituber pfeilii]|nr:ribonuclease-III-like-domain-containing protein [Kalaharituber pfeilii]
MAPPAPLRRTLPSWSACSRCLNQQPHLPRKSLSPFLTYSLQQSRASSSEAAAQAESQSPAREYGLPRIKIYQHTRPQPRAPVRTREPAPEFRVNDNQAVLDQMYEKLFGMGPRGANVLPEDLRWQAVTHASFDHGRQPYNNKLAFLGRRILFFHVNLHIINQTPLPSSKPSESSAGPAIVTSDFGTYRAPSPFEHPDYKNLESATYDAVGEHVNDEFMASVARRAGIPKVMRWKPMNVNDLTQSGENTVAMECLHAIIGAIALTRGGLEAKKFVARIMEQRELQN